MQGTSSTPRLLETGQPQVQFVTEPSDRGPDFFGQALAKRRDQHAATLTEGRRIAGMPDRRRNRGQS